MKIAKIEIEEERLRTISTTTLFIDMRVLSINDNKAFYFMDDCGAFEREWEITHSFIDFYRFKKV